MKADENRSNAYKHIHTLVHLIGMNDEAYRDMLLDRYNVKSSKELSGPQRVALIKVLETQAKEVVLKRQAEYQKSTSMATASQIRAIEAMWMGISRMPTREAKKEALNHFCKRITGIAFIGWLNKKSAHKLIKAIQQMGAKSPAQFNNKREVKNARKKETNLA
jgi:hypothetical protein